MSETMSESLDVCAGSNTGASIAISDKQQFSVGSGFDNDVVLRCEVDDPVRLQIELHKGARRLQLLEGAATHNGIDLIAQEYVELKPESVIEFGAVQFSLNGSAGGSVSGSIHGDSDQHDLASSDSMGKKPIATAALVCGMVLDSSDDERQIVQGRVADHDSLHQIQQLVAAMPAPQNIAIDVQNDAALEAAMQDIYRNHGVTAEIVIQGIGHAQVRTEGVDEITIASLEQALQSDLPALHKLDASNTPPLPSADSDKRIDPDKEVEAVVAGEISYLITRDQSRYFVGAVLPSGHTIKSISEGTVVMFRDGEETQLNF